MAILDSLEVNHLGQVAHQIGNMPDSQGSIVKLYTRIQKTKMMLYDGEALNQRIRESANRKTCIKIFLFLSIQFYCDD